MIQEENFNEQQSLALIESMIKTAKNQFSENGFSYLLWGWVVFFCSIAQFVLLHFYQYPKHYMVWLITFLVVIVQVFYVSKQKKKQRVRTYTDELVGYLWLTFVICMMITFFTLGANHIKDEILRYPLLLLLYGMPTFLSGIVLRFRPLVIGGICCWVLSILASFLAYDYQILLVSIAMLVAWIIPGYRLRAKYKASNS